MSIVTAVIPCYNAAAFLADALESIRAQTLPVAETLVVDDGSTDDSIDIAERFGARVLSTRGRHGPATARNLGARAAVTPYVAFLDADDAWLPAHCETLIALLQASPGAAAAFGRIRQLEPGGDIPIQRRSAILMEAALPELLVDNPIPQSAAMVDRVKFLAAGGYREGMRHAEDYELWLRLAEQHSIVASDAVTCRYRMHPDQATAAIPLMIQNAWEARLDSRARLQARGRFDADHARMLTLALQDDLRRAWASGDGETLALLLPFAGRLDEGPALQRSIRARLRALPLRRLWLAIKSVSRAVLRRPSSR